MLIVVKLFKKRLTGDDHAVVLTGINVGFLTTSSYVDSTGFPCGGKCFCSRKISRRRAVLGGGAPPQKKGGSTICPTSEIVCFLVLISTYSHLENSLFFSSDF